MNSRPETNWTFDPIANVLSGGQRSCRETLVEEMRWCTYCHAYDMYRTGSPIRQVCTGCEELSTLLPERPGVHLCETDEREWRACPTDLCEAERLRNRVVELEQAIEKIHWYWSEWRQTEEPLKGHTTRMYCEDHVPRLRSDPSSVPTPCPHCHEGIRGEDELRCDVCGGEDTA